MPILFSLTILVFVVLASGFKKIMAYERGLVFTLGNLSGEKLPGLRFVIPGVQSMKKIDVRTLTLDVPSQDIITRDNVSVKVNAVIYFRVLDVTKCILEVENYLYATSQLAQTTLRSVCGEVDLDDLLVSREKLNERIQGILDEATDPWGIKVSTVEVKHIDLPPEMQRAMAKQAEAERERRAKVIAAEGEYQASEKLAQAAEVIGTQPQALQLRYLQTLADIAVENNSTTVFPIPIELLKAFNSKGNG